MSLPYTLANGPGNLPDAVQLMANFNALLQLSGGTMTGNLLIGNNILNVGLNNTSTSFLSLSRSDVSWKIANETNLRIYETAGFSTNPSTNKYVDISSGGGVTVSSPTATVAPLVLGVPSSQGTTVQVFATSNISAASVTSSGQGSTGINSTSATNILTASFWGNLVWVVISNGTIINFDLVMCLSDTTTPVVLNSIGRGGTLPARTYAVTGIGGTLTVKLASGSGYVCNTFAITVNQGG